MRKKDVEVFHQAVKIADSGKAKNWKDVEQALVVRGYRKAPDLLEGEKIRTMLDIQCSRSKKQL